MDHWLLLESVIQLRVLGRERERERERRGIEMEAETRGDYSHSDKKCRSANSDRRLPAIIRVKKKKPAVVSYASESRQ